MSNPIDALWQARVSGDYMYQQGRKDAFDEIRKIYTTHNLSDEEVLEQIKMVLNREQLKEDK